MLNLNKAIQKFRQLERANPGVGMRLLRNCLEPDLLRPEQLKKYNLIKKRGIAAYGLSANGLKQFGHCKGAATALFLLMGGLDRSGKNNLILMREKMNDGQFHFWLEIEGTGKIIDPTGAQLSKKLYPKHDYSKGLPVRMVGSNQGKYTVLSFGKKRKIDQYTYRILCCCIAKLF